MYMKKDHSLKRKQLNYKKSRYNTKIVKLHFQKITLYIEDDANINVWKSNCTTCDVSRWDILRKLVFTTTNCFLANKIQS